MKEEAKNPSNENSTNSNVAGSTPVVVMSIMGFLTFLWIGAATIFPNLSPWGSSGSSSKGVVVLDMTSYMVSNPNLSDADLDAAWGGAIALADDLASKGFVVMQPDLIVDAPRSAYITDKMIDKWAQAYLEANGQQGEGE